VSETGPDIKKGVSRGLAWVGLASGLVGVLDILALALILGLGWVSTEEFGRAAMAFTLFPILDISMGLGLNAAVIQRDDHSPEVLSTVFWLGLLLTLIVFAILTLGVGPLLASIHDQPILVGLLTAYGGKLIWQNVYLLPLAQMQKELRFKELSVIRTIANFAEFAAKIGTAAAGFGIWCFVAGPICRAIVTGVGVQSRNFWVPRFVFNFSRAKEWAIFGLKTSAHKLIFRAYNALDYLIVSIYFGEVALGIYTIAFLIVLEPALIISEVVIRVAFPAFSKLKHDAQKMFEQLVSFSRMNLVLMLTFVGLTFVAAEEILAIISSAKGNDYTSGASIIRLLCGVAILRALSFVIPPMLDGAGKPTLTLIYAVVASVVLSAMFLGFAEFLGPSMGADSVALAWLLGYPIAFLVLISMAFSILDKPRILFFKHLAGIALSGTVATALAGGAKLATLSLPTPIRFAIVALTMLGVFYYLLGRFHGISPKSIKAALK
jgi:teichuronic acid exporter